MLGWILAAAPAAGASSQVAGTLFVDELDNGSFDEPEPAFLDSERRHRIPGWRSSRGFELLVCAQDRVWLRLSPGDWARQPLAVYAPYVDRLRVRGLVGGRGQLVVSDGAGRRAVFEMSAPDGEARHFELTGLEIRERLGTRPLPSLELSLLGLPGARVYWSDLEVWCELPQVSSDELRAEILGHLDWIVPLWLEHGLDRWGARETAFLAQRFDVRTGAPVHDLQGGWNPFYSLLLDVVGLVDRPEWCAALERFVADYLELGFSPSTHLPRAWDPRRDVPIEESYREVSLDLAFLLDLAERGPVSHREEARALARRLGETVLERGCLPDGEVATRYRASDGAADVETPPIRRLDLPAQLGRLGALDGDERFERVAGRAFSRFLYTHHWQGSWDRIDPAFDDLFGNYAQRALTLWRAFPDKRVYRQLVLDGFEHFEPMWRDSLRLGGYVAADEVRCWQIILDAARLEPDLAHRVAPLIERAVRSHYKCQQYANGTWGDVTFVDYGPQHLLEVGDLQVLPRNLLFGIALAHGSGLELQRDVLRARYAVALRSTFDHHARAYGFLSSHEETDGSAAAGGSIRIMQALVEMLRALDA